MKRRAFVPWIAGSVVLVAAAGLVSSRALPLRQETAVSAPEPVPAASAPRSCKAVPPVRITLEPGAAPDLWRLHLEAVEAVPAVTVTLGARAGGRDLSRALVWTGAVDAGTKRDFEARLLPGEAATRVWAEADAAGTPGGTLRSTSGVELQAGKVVTSAATSADQGRKTTDPRTGETVIEYQGATGGTR